MEAFGYYSPQVVLQKKYCFYDQYSIQRLCFISYLVSYIKNHYLKKNCFGYHLIICIKLASVKKIVSFWFDSLLKCLFFRSYLQRNLVVEVQHLTEKHIQAGHQEKHRILKKQNFSLICKLLYQCKARSFSQKTTYNYCNYFQLIKLC